MLIYAIKNNVNGKVYVGQTTRRLSERYSGGWHKRTRNQALKNAAKKYGIESFTLIVLEECQSREELCQKEKEWAEKLNAYAPAGYNFRECGNGGWMGKRGPEFSRKMSLIHKGKVISDEHKRAVSKPVLCSNGIQYPSTIAAARALGVRQGHVSECANGRRPRAGAYTFSWVVSNG